jgi:hypothetical protein
MNGLTVTTMKINVSWDATNYGRFGGVQGFRDTSVPISGPDDGKSKHL